MNILDNLHNSFLTVIVYKSKIGDWDGKTLERKSMRSQQMNRNDHALQYSGSDCKDYEKIPGL